MDGPRRPSRRTIRPPRSCACSTTIGIERVHAFVGASYGGMVALAFAERYPQRVERLVVISAAHEPHPMSTALRALQRRIVELGLETGRVHEALALARGLAMTTYRSAREFARAVRRPPRSTTRVGRRDLRRRALSARTTASGSPRRGRAERFLALSLSGDLHRVDPAPIRTPTVIVAAEGDAIVPAEQLEQLAATIAAPTR